MVRFRCPTNHGMFRYQANVPYPLGPGVEAWLKSRISSENYEIVDGPEEEAAEPATMRTPKVASRTASSKKSAKAAKDKAAAEAAAAAGGTK